MPSPVPFACASRSLAVSQCMRLHNGGGRVPVRDGGAQTLRAGRTRVHDAARRSGGRNENFVEQLKAVKVAVRLFGETDSRTEEGSVLSPTRPYSCARTEGVGGQDPVGGVLTSWAGRLLAQALEAGWKVLCGWGWGKFANRSHQRRRQ